MLPGALNTRAWALVFEGQLENAGSLIREAREILDATASNFLASVAAIHAGLQARDGAIDVIDEQIEMARGIGTGLSLKAALWARAVLGNGTGDYDAACAAGREAMRHPWEWSSHLCFHEHVEAAVRAGQESSAQATVEELRRSTEASGSDWALGILRRCEALLAADDGAERLYLDAIDRLGRTPLRLELARAHLLFGEWLRRQNRRLDARAELRTAYDAFVDMGTRAFAERARHELLATGETVRPRSVDSFDQLTPQEAHITRLAGEGCTNAEIGSQLFISARTVEWHLRKVFTKLGVRSRRELAAAMARRA
jgi:ATP/maltotriose-dependent transcriptional regulator MalT